MGAQHKIPPEEATHDVHLDDDLPFPTSLPEFQSLFPDDEACARYMERIRWPHGFSCDFCEECDPGAEPYRFRNRPYVLRCRTCKTDHWLTAGTIMARTHKPLAIWFWGAYLVSSMTPGMSAVQFQRQLGLKRYETAFQMLHKLRAAMVRPHRDRIGTKDIPVQMDETWIGGRTRGEGRGVHHKVLVGGIVEVRTRKPKERPILMEQTKAVPRRGNTYAGRLRLRILTDRTGLSLETFARDSIQPGTFITTDDWSGYDRLNRFGFLHRAVAERNDPKVADEYLPLIHLVFSNLKSWLLGIHHGVSPKHLQAYLNEFVFRFNRRFYPFNAFRSLLGIAGHNQGPTYAALYGGGYRHPNPVAVPATPPPPKQLWLPGT